MREIKFKYVWIDLTGKTYLTKCFTIDEIEKQEPVKYWAKINIAKYSLIARLQFTGLPDKNNREIYEGDIVKYSNREVEEICCIEFWKGAFYAIRKTGKPYLFTERLSIYFLEVIGNFFENPELFKEGKGER